MKLREMGYKHHGLSNGDARQILRYIRSDAFNRHDIVMACAIASNSAIADELYSSIVDKISYDRLTVQNYIPLPKVDFYGYRRLCLANIKDAIESSEEKSVYKSNRKML